MLRVVMMLHGSNGYQYVGTICSRTAVAVLVSAYGKYSQAIINMFKV